MGYKKFWGKKIHNLKTKMGKQSKPSFATRPPRAQDCQDPPAKWDSLAMNECSFTGQTWFYPVSHRWKLENGSVLRLTPGVHRIKQGLDLRLDRLRLRVDCAQRAMRWSTYGWTLLSHSNRVYVIASCVGPCQRPLRNPCWSNLSACARCPRFITLSRLLMISCTDCTSWVSQDLPLRNPCWQSASTLSKAKCLLMLFTIICSRVLLQMQVSNTGL